MAELLIKGTKVAEKVNNVVFQYSDMYVNKQTFTQDLTLDVSYNATMTGPITVNNLTVNGNLVVSDSVDITGNANITGTLKLIEI